jgi:hypothetical protein
MVEVSLQIEDVYTNLCMEHINQTGSLEALKYVLWSAKHSQFEAHYPHGFLTEHWTRLSRGDRKGVWIGNPRITPVVTNPVSQNSLKCLGLWELCPESVWSMLWCCDKCWKRETRRSGPRKQGKQGKQKK